MEIFKTTFDCIKIFFKMKYNLLSWDKLSARRSHAAKWLQVLIFRVDVVIFRIRIMVKCFSCFSGSKNYCQVSSLGKRTDGRQRLELLFQLDKDSTEFTGKRHSS